jgi:hypothetical protein
MNLILPPGYNPKLIGIHGHAGVGKDTLAQYFHKTRPDTWWLAFAEPLREAASKMFGIPMDVFTSPVFKNDPNVYWGVSPREILQFVGTELIRNHIEDLWRGAAPGLGANFWITRMYGILIGELDSLPYTDEDTVVISDVRFQNEYDWIIANKGIIIHLTRPGHEGKVGIPGHQSEAGINITTPERTFHLENNSTLDDLYAKADVIVNASGIYPFHSPDQF